MGALTKPSAGGTWGHERALNGAVLGQCLHSLISRIFSDTNNSRTVKGSAPLPVPGCPLTQTRPGLRWRRAGDGPTRAAGLAPPSRPRGKGKQRRNEAEQRKPTDRTAPSPPLPRPSRHRPVPSRSGPGGDRTWRGVPGSRRAGPARPQQRGRRRRPGLRDMAGPPPPPPAAASCASLPARPAPPRSASAKWRLPPAASGTARGGASGARGKGRGLKRPRYRYRPRPLRGFGKGTAPPSAGKPICICK